MSSPLLVASPAPPDATATAPAERPGRRLAIIAVAFWTVLGLVETGKDYVASHLRGEPQSWLFALVADMPWWYTWLLLTPVVLWLARRTRLDGPRWWRGLALHAVAGLAISIAHLVIEGTIFFLLKPAGSPGPTTLRGQWIAFYNAYLMTDLLTYGAVVGGYFAIEYYERFRRSALESARLEAQSARLALGLAEARMHALRMELNPHFLFNTLNAISGLVRKQESAAAIDMLARLGDLLRATLDQAMPPVIPVTEELALLERYLDIERVRFGHRLTIEIDVAADVARALVPTLFLQPLVENAIRHGVTRRPGSALVRIAARRVGPTLHLEVRDTGEGLAASGGRPLREGIGLTNSRARLTALYGDAASLHLGDAPGGGARVDVTMPFTTEADALPIAIGA
jgi:hypothetical protein